MNSSWSDLASPSSIKHIDEDLVICDRFVDSVSESDLDPKIKGRILYFDEIWSLD